MFSEFVKEVTKELEAKESRKRARGADAQISFNYAVGHILTEIWRDVLSYPPRESTINLRSGYYSELDRYRDPQLTYRQVKAAFDTLIECRYIEVTTKGYFSRERGTGGLTRFAPTDRLLERFENLEGHPAFVVSPNLDLECIILRDKLDGTNNIDIPYTDTPKTERFRNNLRAINECLIKHWADLRIKDSGVEKLAQRVLEDPDKEPIDLSRRILTRIFSNGSFDQGGRFYRGWWQNVPSEYRPYITIDEQVTTEYDYSQLSPHMLYFSDGKDLGNEDAYDRVLDGQHRDVVKQAFNAMVQSSKVLTRSPNKIDLSSVDLDWKTLRDRILETHKPIQHLFFQGKGNQLQFWDSCMAESIMLHFAAQNEPVLPIHDSFIMRRGYASELEEVMRKAFRDKFGNDIRIKAELIVEREALYDIDGKPRIEAVTKDDRQHSQWYDRNTMWLSKLEKLRY